MGGGVMDQPSSALFYLQDSRGYVGNNVSWWAKDGNSYTTNLSNAQLYTLDEAQRLHDSRVTDIPWPRDYVDVRVRQVVDMQYLKQSEAGPVSGSFYIQNRSKFDGNDVYWLTNERGGVSTDISKAMVFSFQDGVAKCDELVSWPLDYVRTKVRPSVDRQELKRDEALDGSGIVLTKQKKAKVERIKCHQCGCFMSEAQLWAGECPKCGADNRP